jgi:threonine aldolase
MEHASNRPVIDLRSDTVTRPTPAMRAAMADAEVGDDVYGDDPSVAELQTFAAELLGKEAALYLPSGTQSNLCAVMAHCARGDEYLIGDNYHILCHEAGGTAVLGSAVPAVLTTNDAALLADDVTTAIKPDDPHFPRTRLLCLENTVSGKALTPAQLEAPAQAARAAGLKVHLDGARFFNAVVATGSSAREMAAPADSVSVCLSKGLGAPVGSVLVGDAATIASAHRIRKMLGGGMRQAGILAAAGMHALTHHVDRLADDHKRASLLGQQLNDLGALWKSPVTVQTNMLFIEPLPHLRAGLFSALDAAGIHTGKPAARKRLVVHLDIGDAEIERIAAACLHFSEQV